MMRKVIIGLFAATLMAGLPVAHAANPVLDTATGKLIGATGVDVGGTLYDVEFVDGTCVGLFSGCDSASDFTFSQEATIVAHTALLEQVFIDGAQGPFDSNPPSTRGCDSVQCAVYIPFMLVPPDRVAYRATLNSTANNDSTLGSVLVDSDTSFDSSALWARFTLSSTPPPPTIICLEATKSAINAARDYQAATRDVAQDCGRKLSVTCAERLQAQVDAFIMLETLQTSEQLACQPK